MRAWTVEALLFLIYFAFGISWFAFAPLRGDIEGFYHITKAEGGALFSAVGIAKSFVPVLAGFLVARLGLKWSLAVGAAFCALSLAVPFSPDYKTLLWLRFLFGVGGALVITLTGPIVMGLFPRERLPLINGINNVAVNAGIVTSFYLVPPLAQSFSWKTILVLFGLISVVLCVLWVIVGQDAPAASKAPGPLGSAGNAPEPVGFLEVAKRKETWLIALAFSGPLALYLALNSTLPAHLGGLFNLAPKQASQLTSLFNLVGIPTAIFSGWITGKLGLRRPLIIGAGLLMPVASLALCFGPFAFVRLAGAIGLGISLFLYVAPLFTIPMELPGSSAAFVARLNGIVFSGAYMLAGTSPMIVGHLFDRSGTYSWGLAFFCVSSILLAVGGYLLPETGPKARPSA
jgi:cyanate permease